MLDTRNEEQKSRMLFSPLFSVFWNIFLSFSNFEAVGRIHGDYMHPLTYGSLLTTSEELKCQQFVSPSGNKLILNKGTMV